MPQTGVCTDVTCSKELTELYQCHCCNWFICLKHLLEHVDVSKRDKQIKFDILRNDLKSSSYTLELLVESKLQQIECEKRLINQAKAVLNKSECTIEEIQMISNDINHVIVANQKEETIVKVEPLLAETKNSTIDNETLLSANSSSSSNHVCHEPKSPTYFRLTTRINVSPDSSTPNNSGRSTIVRSLLSMNNSSSNDENMDPDSIESPCNDKENGVKRKNFFPPCPLTFDGAFGLTKEKHSLEVCSVDNHIRRNLVGHLTLKHKLKKVYARRLYQAIQNNKDPKTKLFTENEDVIDHERLISCPLSNRMIHLIGCCPTESRKVPCQLKSIQSIYLTNHLVKHHCLPTNTAREIAKKYRERLSTMNASNGNNTLSINRSS